MLGIYCMACQNGGFSRRARLHGVGQFSASDFELNLSDKIWKLCTAAMFITVDMQIILISYVIYIYVYNLSPNKKERKIPESRHVITLQNPLGELPSFRRRLEDANFLSNLTCSRFHHVVNNDCSKLKMCGVGMARSGVNIYTKFRNKNRSAGLISEIVETQTDTHREHCDLRCLLIP
jgi:hypothetical protein